MLIKSFNSRDFLGLCKQKGLAGTGTLTQRRNITAGTLPCILKDHRRLKGRCNKGEKHFLFFQQLNIHSSAVRSHQSRYPGVHNTKFMWWYSKQHGDWQDIRHFRDSQKASLQPDAAPKMKNWSIIGGLARTKTCWQVIQGHQGTLSQLIKLHSPTKF